MEKTPKMLWNDCLALIRENVSEQQYKTWFEPIAFSSYNEDDRTLLVQIPSRYIYEVLEQYYVELLSKVLYRCFGDHIALKYRVVVDKTHGLTLDEEGSEAVAIDAPEATTRGNKAPTALDAATPQDLNPQLDPHKTFQRYIEGDSNKLPRTIGSGIKARPSSLRTSVSIWSVVAASVSGCSSALCSRKK